MNIGYSAVIGVAPQGMVLFNGTIIVLEAGRMIEEGTHPCGTVGAPGPLRQPEGRSGPRVHGGMCRSVISPVVRRLGICVLPYRCSRHRGTCGWISPAGS